MTREQHLDAAEMLGEDAVYSISIGAMEHAETIAVFAFHHALAAQRCEDCYRPAGELAPLGAPDQPIAWYMRRCSRCGGTGWLPRAER